MMFRGNFTKEDRVLVESIYDKLNQPKVRRKLTKQAKNNDPKQFAESIFPEVFAEAAQECYGDQMEAFRRLFQNHDLYNSIMSQMGDMMYANFRAQDEAVFNPERFKEKVLPVMQAEFGEIQGEIKPYTFVADWLVRVIAAETAPSMDGANDVLQNAFNRLYCSPRKVAFMDKKSHFRSLVSFFEVFLKKIYFIENGKEMVVTRENARPGEMPALGDCIYQTPCLKRLKYEPDSNKFKIWLQQLRDWRNEQSHQAPIATEPEYDAAIHIVTALYLYVTAYNIKLLQPKLQASVSTLNADHHYIDKDVENIADESKD